MLYSVLNSYQDICIQCPIAIHFIKSLFTGPSTEIDYFYNCVNGFKYRHKIIQIHENLEKTN